MTRFNYGNGTETAIDITIISSSIAPKLTWDSINNFTASDHNPVTINTTFSNFIQISKSQKYIFGKANWTQCGSQITNSTVILSNDILVDKSLQNLNTCILEAANANIPRTSSIIKRRLVPWWNEQMKKSLKLRNSTLQKFRNIRSLTHFELFNNLQVNNRK